jgi:hypothetical protein
MNLLKKNNKGGRVFDCLTVFDIGTCIQNKCINNIYYRSIGILKFSFIFAN